MSLDVTIKSGDPARVAADVLAVPVFSERELGPGAKEISKALGDLHAFMEDTDFLGKRGELLFLPAGKQITADTVLLVGVGEKDKITISSLRDAAGNIARRTRTAGVVATTLSGLTPKDSDPTSCLQAITEGFMLGAYQYLEFKSEAKVPKLRRVILIGKESAAARDAIERGLVVADAVSWARDLVNEPSGHKPPQAIAAETVRLMRDRRVRVQIMDERRIRLEGLGGVEGVGQGSSRPPRFIKLTYTPKRSKGSIALVGKGVVFDTGGISIKPAVNMEAMKTDMAGAAAVIATISACADLDIPVKVTGYVPLVENMPSGSAIRPGDVLTMRNGKTVEVLNTDAEGRLILADALALAVEGGADAIIDLATLTGSCVIALGESIAGLMGTDETWNTQVREAADRAGESVWPLPLPEQYRSKTESSIADLQNIAGREGGTLTAGLFLQAFVDDVPWVHLDIAGPSSAKNDDGHIAKGGTGFGVRTMLELLANYKRPESARRSSRKKTTKTRPAARGTRAKTNPR